MALSSLLFAACSADLPTAEYPNQPPISFSHAPGGNIVLDQSQPNPDPVNPFTIAIGGQSSQIIAQVFTVGIGGKLRQVEVPVGCGGGTLVLEVRNVVAGVPGTSVLAREGFAPSSLPPVVGPFAVLRLMPSPTLVRGTQYALVFSNATAPAGSAACCPAFQETRTPAGTATAST